MKTLSGIESFREIRKTLSDKSVGFIPTMGNCHAGHVSLVERARAENDICVVSIFVNPTQFNDSKDFTSYPKSLGEDKMLLERCGCDYLLTPSVKAMYPDNYTWQVQETHLSQTMEGFARPGHFTGMLTVVMKLLQWVKPQRAYFGEKDYQQLQLVKAMCEAFFIDCDIVACETVRNELGLALSSRNQRLSAKGLEMAAQFPQLLRAATSRDEAEFMLTNAGFSVDYVTEQDGRRFAAVSHEGVRLIDNIVLDAS